MDRRRFAYAELCAASVQMKAVRIGLCVLFAFSVLAHGVVEVWSESVLEMGASAPFYCLGLSCLPGSGNSRFNGTR